MRKKRGQNTGNGTNNNQGKQRRNKSNGNKYCAFCNMSNHFAQDCTNVNNLNSIRYKGNKNQPQNQNRLNTNTIKKRPRSCRNCGDEHFDNECPTNSTGQNNQSYNTLPAGAVQPWQGNQTTSFNRACQWYSKPDHYSYQCSTHRSTMPYTPTVYPTPPILPTGMIYHFTQSTPIRYEYISPTTNPQHIERLITSLFSGPTRYEQGTQHCDHLPYVDRDGDVIMEPVERCALCRPQRSFPNERFFLQNWGAHLTRNYYGEGHQVQNEYQYQGHNQIGSNDDLF